MPLFNKESLEKLRQNVNLIEVLSTHVDLKKSGTAFKGLCPFHDEKTPSFVVQRGDSHYHCFGCGVHGDAIQFLMTHQKMSFSEAVESLAHRFHVQLETLDEKEVERGPNKELLKLALKEAAQFYHFYLLHTLEGHEALQYLYGRAIDLEFIKHFQLGLAPKTGGMLRKFMHTKDVRDDVLAAAGLLTPSKEGQWRDFFYARIMFPIHSHIGDVIGFSARKYKEDTYGGKYINTPETPLFKKSKILFGIQFSRKRIAKERKAIIVEGQIDALRLIDAGLNFTVASQGTAFGEGHVKELINLGVNKVFLALDSDQAGQEASAKIGHLFQKEGIEVQILSLPLGHDPDTFLREKGSQAFLDLIENSVDYLSFLITHLSRNLNIDSPATKNEVIQNAVKIIREWDHPVMVHESLRKLSHMMKVPEEYVGVGREIMPNIYIKKAVSVGMKTIDPDRILETDLLRWLILFGQEQNQWIEIVQSNLKKEDFHVPVCQKIFDVYLSNYLNRRSCDLLSLAIDVDDVEGQLVLADLVQKKVNRERAEAQVIETIQKILDRNWMKMREEIKISIQSGKHSDNEALELAKQFDHLKRNPPRVKLAS